MVWSGFLLCVALEHMCHRATQTSRPDPWLPPLCSCYNCGGLDHHAKECGLPPQPKKCHYCQSITHMVAQCPHKALAPASGSQDQHASTSAFLCPPEEGERSGSSPLEGSSSSPEEPHTHCGPRTQRWRKSWIQGNRFTANPLPPLSPLNQGYLKPPPPTPPHLPHIYEQNGRSWFHDFAFICICIFFLTAQLWQWPTGYGRERMCVWLSCSRLVQLWQPLLE